MFCIQLKVIQGIHLLCQLPCTRQLCQWSVSDTYIEQLVKSHFYVQQLRNRKIDYHAPHRKSDQAMLEFGYVIREETEN